MLTIFAKCSISPSQILNSLLNKLLFCFFENTMTWTVITVKEVKAPSGVFPGKVTSDFFQ